MKNLHVGHLEILALTEGKGNYCFTLHSFRYKCVRYDKNICNNCQKYQSEMLEPI